MNLYVSSDMYMGLPSDMNLYVSSDKCMGLRT